MDEWVVDKVNLKEWHTVDTFNDTIALHERTSLLQCGGVYL